MASGSLFNRLRGLISGSVPAKIEVLGKPSARERGHITAPRKPLDHGAVHLTGAVVPGGRIISRPPLLFHGGAYVGGRLVRESRLQRRHMGRIMSATLPFEELPPVTQRLERAVYGGCLFAHFGHFMVESTARLWWTVENRDPAPVIFQTLGNRIPGFARRFMELAGITPVFLTPDQCCAVDSLVVPSAASIERIGAAPVWMRIFDALRENVGTDGQGRTGELLFVSRGTGVAPVFGEATVQAALIAQGYEVLDPTQASLEDQVRAFARAQKIVGFVGSAMHNVVYAAHARQIAYLARVGAISATYPITDQAIGRHRSTYVYEALTPLPLISGGLETPFLIDSAACLARLHEAGFLARPHRPDPQGQIADRDAYTAEWNRIDRLVRAKKGVR